jgi:hypothetical protein
VQIERDGTINIIAGMPERPNESDLAPEDLRRLI